MAEARGKDVLCKCACIKVLVLPFALANRQVGTLRDLSSQGLGVSSNCWPSKMPLLPAAHAAPEGGGNHKSEHLITNLSPLCRWEWPACGSGSTTTVGRWVSWLTRQRQELYFWEDKALLQSSRLPQVWGRSSIILGIT
eukprot:1140065-Pelagomonas_calceolata.AAC.1